MRRNITKKIDLLLSFVIIAILLPLFITIICQRMRLEQLIYGGLETVGEGAVFGTEMQEVTAVPAIGGDVEEQLLGIVAKEINVGANREAILAQCVIARTNLCDARVRGTAEPEALDIDEMQALWGEHFEDAYQELLKCVALTEGQVLVWNGNYIYAAYHTLSAGRTRDIAALYEEAQMPYLVERACQEDVTAEGYLTVTYRQTEEFLQECRAQFPDATIERVTDIVVQTRDNAGYVQELLIGDVTCLGEDFRSRLGLNSACFAITETGNEVRIVTKGLGHGVGLSQHMAGCMAEEGMDYKEILAYFYPETELKTISSLK